MTRPGALWFAGLALSFFLAGPSRAGAQEVFQLREAFPAGYHYHVSSRVDVTGSLTLPPEKDQKAPATLGVTGSSAIEYDERVLSHDRAGQVSKTVRFFRR